MKRLLSFEVLSGALLLASWPVLAVDHDHIDANRPLDFDDAETIAFREKAIEFGGALVKPRDGKIGLGGEVELAYGFARNWQAKVGIDPQYASENGGQRRFDVGSVGAGIQHNFNRETETSPAFGVRFDADFPTGRGARGTALRLRGIASKKFGTYGRLHFNADLSFKGAAQNGERKTTLGAIVGYSVPLGFPMRFNRTLVSQIGFRANPPKGEGALLNLGIGLRQQVTPRAVFDIGIKSDLTGSGEAREKYRLVAGYSTAF